MQHTQEISTIDILAFYGWWQTSICLFAFLGLMAIWWHIGRRQGDFGQVWLALSILSWSFSGIVEVVFSQQDLTIQQAVYRDGLRSIFSLLNSLFILLGLPWFRYLPTLLKHIIQSRYWIFIVGLPFLFSILPTISRMVSSKSSGFVNELDVYYSVLTLGFLGYVLWESFAKRNLKILAWLSVLCIITTLIAQAYKLTDAHVNMLLFSGIFKSSLIMIFFALALSWVKELTENHIPPSKKIRIQLSRIKLQSKPTNQVVIAGVSGKGDPMQLSPSLFQLLLRFMVSKLDGNQWLEIKPKKDPRSEKQYAINDHNEVKRLINSLLDGLFGVGQWTKELHEIPLRAALFEMSEKRERKIRLAIPPENLILSDELKIEISI